MKLGTTISSLALSGITAYAFALPSLAPREGASSVDVLQQYISALEASVHVDLGDISESTNKERRSCQCANQLI